MHFEKTPISITHAKDGKIGSTPNETGWTSIMQGDNNGGGGAAMFYHPLLIA